MAAKIESQYQRLICQNKSDVGKDEENDCFSLKLTQIKPKSMLDPKDGDEAVIDA